MIDYGSCRYRGPIDYAQGTVSAAIRWSNGDYYEGRLTDGELHGRGTYIWADGTRYEGVFIHGQTTGRGKLWMPNGDRYEGFIKNGKPHWSGTFFYKDGEIRSGRWNRGKFTGEIPGNDEGGEEPAKGPACGWHPAYDTLTAKEKEAYVQMEEAFGSLERSFDASPLTKEEGLRVRDAFCSDHPDLFWASGNIRMITDKNGTVLSFEIQNMPGDAEIMRMDRELRDALSAIRIEGSTDLEKIRAINDWLCANLTYDNRTWNSWNAYGAFVERRCKCAGFTQAVNYLCRLHGIESLYIIGDVIEDIQSGSGGSSHAWNLVRIDGAWYHMDATWNCNGCPGFAGYEYFLIGSETVIGEAPLKDCRVADHYFGKDPSPSSYGFDPRERPPYKDCIWIASDKLDEIYKSRNIWTYSAGDLVLDIRSTRIKPLVDGMRKRKSERFFVLVEWDGPSASDDRMNNIEIRMFMDREELSPADMGMSGAFSITLPDIRGKVPEICDPSGRRLGDGTGFPLDRTGAYAYRYAQTTLDAFRAGSRARNCFYYSVCIHRACT